MSNNCFYKNCPLRMNTTSSVYTCYRNNCSSRIGAQAQPSTVVAPPTEAYEDCLGCQHFPVCRDAEQKISPCEHRLPHLTIDENKMRRVYQQVEDHGGIHHLIGLDQLAWEGRLVVLPGDPEKKKLVWQTLEKLDLYSAEGKNECQK